MLKMILVSLSLVWGYFSLTSTQSVEHSKYEYSSAIDKTSNKGSFGMALTDQLLDASLSSTRDEETEKQINRKIDKNNALVSQQFAKLGV